MPRDAGSGLSGLSDTMAPGNITQLALSDDIAFRVRFIDPEPAPSKLYWRGVVLGDYDGRTWRPLPAGVPRGQATLRVRGKPVRHEITLEPNGKRWLFTLELPMAPPRLNDRDTYANGDLQLLASRAVAERVRYEAASYPDFELLMAGTRTTLRAWRDLPDGFNPQTLAFAARLRRDYPDDEKLVEAVLRHFRTEKFYYTLEPPALGRDEIDDFLFRTRAGFCEHYASAFTVLMRAAGIPARVVTGYQGGTDNPVDGYMIVRQSDAHAWAEVWFADHGWVRVDPTAAVAPERVLQGTGSVLPRRALGGLITLGTSGTDWLSRLRFNWDAITNRWNQWVLSYSMDRQQSLLRALGFSEPDWRTLMGLLAAVGSVVLGIIAFPLLRNRQRPDPVNACYRALCDAMARRGLPRALHEGPHAYRERLAADGSPLDAQRKAAAMRFLQVYEKLQYGVVDKAGRTAALSELKSLLSTCR
jgi:transglutaminase-like putative cysteine protease